MSNPTVVVSALAIQAGVPMLWWGPPGTGKSSTMAAMGLALGRHTEVIISSIREPSDFGGLPAIIDKAVHMVPPRWAIRLNEAATAGIPGVAFFDEINTAAPAVQAGLLRVILDRVVGDLALPPIVSMAAAANAVEQAAGGWDLAAPLANRFWHGQWQMDNQAWVHGILGGFPAPEVPRLRAEWDVTVPTSNALVGSFINHRPTLLLQVPNSASDAGKAWPSPRSWTMAARLLAASSAAGYSTESDVAMTAVAGCVGPGPATEILAWIKEMDLPDPEAILKAPEKFSLPKRSDRQFAVLASVAAAVVQNVTVERYLAGWKVMAIAAKDGPKDVAAAAAGSLMLLHRRKQDLPVPTAELKAFLPLLKAAGMVAA